MKKWITRYVLNGKIIEKTHYSEEAQDKFVGYLWDYEVMEKVDWIDFQRNA